MFRYISVGRLSYFDVTIDVVSVGRLSVGVVVVMSVVIVSGCELMCSTGVGSWVCVSGCCSTGARIMSSWPAPIITIRSMMLKIKRFIVGVN